MPFSFDKNKFVENVEFLLKEQNKKIGEFETAAGLNLGYISRIAKADNTKPNIENIVNIADELNVSVDSILRMDYNALSVTERYYVNFFEKLIEDTAKDKLDWQKETATMLSSCPSETHPLIEWSNNLHCDYFCSDTYGEDTRFYGSSFNLRLKNQTYLYIMNIIKNANDDMQKINPAREVWLYSQVVGKVFIGSSKGANWQARKIDCLYGAIETYMLHPTLNKNFRDAIDAFMKDDLTDDVIKMDFDSDIPF